MKLNHITFQGAPRSATQELIEQCRETWSLTSPLSVPERSLLNCYRTFLDGEKRDYIIAAVQEMIRLQEYLERMDGPEVWGFTSHHAIVLVDRDFETYGEWADDEESLTVSVAPLYHGVGFEVSRSLQKSLRPWNSLKGTSQEIHVVGSMVRDVFNRRLLGI